MQYILKTEDELMDDIRRLEMRRNDVLVEKNMQFIDIECDIQLIKAELQLLHSLGRKKK